MNKIVDRIQKLLERTIENGATEAEAEQALEYANKLLEKHNLELEQVLAQKGEEELQINSETVQYKAEFKLYEKWVAKAVAKLTDTEFTWQQTDGGQLSGKIRVKFYGTPFDLSIAKPMYIYLTLMCRVSSKKALGKVTWQYCKGFAIGLHRTACRLKEQTQVRALIVKKGELITNHLAGVKVSNFGAGKVDDDVRKGLEDGEAFDLQAPRKALQDESI